MKTDAQIQKDVLRELKLDERVDETDVGIEVDDAIVTLTGTVSSYTKRVAAQEAAHRVPDVLDVANNIVVRLPGMVARSDTDLARALRKALEWDVVVPDTRIHSTVCDGRVLLEGDVETWHEREAAEHAVRSLPGVRDVTNRISVASQKAATGRVRDEIEHALERRAERHAKDIDVELHDGKVVLSGQVDSWAEKRAILGAARFVNGVRDVEDHLQIAPPAAYL